VRFALFSLFLLFAFCFLYINDGSFILQCVNVVVVVGFPPTGNTRVVCV